MHITDPSTTVFPSSSFKTSDNLFLMQLKVTKNHKITLNFIICIVAGAQRENEKESLDNENFLKTKEISFILFYSCQKRKHKRDEERKRDCNKIL